MDKESENLFSRIGKLKDAGVSVIYISHRLDEVLRISDRLSVLRDGQTIATPHNTKYRSERDH